MNNTEFFTTARIAGILLMLGNLILLGSIGLIAAKGRLGGMSAAFLGVGSGTGDASGLRTIARAALPSTMAQLAGFALLTLVLVQAGDQGTAVIALVFLVFWFVLGAIEASYQASATVWAAEQMNQTGTVPDFFEPLRRWLNAELQPVNMSFGLLAILLYSLSVLRLGLLPPWVGWIALTWSMLSFRLYYLVLGAPLIIFVSPLLFSVGLLLHG